MVETYQTQVTSRPVAQQDLRVSPSPAAFGAAVGDGVNRLAAAFSDAAKAVEYKEELVADADARAAQIAFVKATQDIRYDAENGYLVQTGGNALNRLGSYEDAIAAARDSAMKGLSPAAQRKFLRLTDDHVLSVREQGIRHDAAQLREYTFRSGEAAADLHVNEAMRHDVGSAAFAENIAKAEAEVERVGLLAGLPPEAREVSKRTLRSGALRGAITRVANSGPGGPTRALAILEENKGRMSADDVAALETALRPLQLRDEATTRLNAAERGGGDGGGGGGAAVPGRGVAGAGGRSAAVAAAMHGIGNVKMANAGSVRNLPITDSLRGEISAAVAAVYGPGAKAVVYSGGQPGKGAPGAKRIGTTAHDHGHAADIRVYGPDGKQITGDGLAPLAQYWLAARKGGAGLEMRGGGIHLDEHSVRTWNYANPRDGGRITAAQRAAVEAGLAGTMPSGIARKSYSEHLFSEFDAATAKRIAEADPSRSMVEILGLEEATRRGVAGINVGTYQRRFSVTAGVPGAPAPARKVDRAGVYEVIADVMRTNPELGAEMARQAAARFAADDAADAAQRQEVFDAAWRKGIETGDWNIGIDTRLALGDSLSAAFDKAAAAALSGVQNTDPVVFGELQDRALNDPENFKLIDLGDYLARGVLNDADYRKLREMQSVITANSSPQARAAEMSKVLGGVDPRELWQRSKETYQSLMGVDLSDRRAKEADKAQAERFKRALTDKVAEETARKGEALTPLEIDRIVYALLTPVEGDDGGWLFGPTKVPMFDRDFKDVKPATPGTVPRLSAVRPDLRDTAMVLAAEQLGREATGDEVVVEARRVLADLAAVARGAMPEARIEDAPPAVLATRKSRWFGEDTYTVPGPDGAPREVTESELLAGLAKVRYNAVATMMARRGITPEFVLGGLEIGE